MTLGRLILAWLPVAALFAIAQWLVARRRPELRALAAPTLEAVGVTLFASLWFDSLGHGGWVLLFLLVGALVAYAPRLRVPHAAASPAPPERPRWWLGVADMARYVAAGGILAWRLG